jgi:hypothetical protein
MCSSSVIIASRVGPETSNEMLSHTAGNSHPETITNTQPPIGTLRPTMDSPTRCYSRPSQPERQQTVASSTGTCDQLNGSRPSTVVDESIMIQCRPGGRKIHTLQIQIHVRCISFPDFAFLLRGASFAQASSQLEI